MTQTETLRLALRAMVVNNQAWKHLADSGDAGNFDAEEQGYYQLNEQAIIAVEAALEAKDEPVAWRAKNTYENQEGWFYAKWHPDGLTPQVAELLYTTPPQRTWVGLTDDEIVLISAECAATHQHTDIHFAQAIEAKLKEKNI
jgi:hypothetical protein